MCQNPTAIQSLPIARPLLASPQPHQPLVSQDAEARSLTELGDSIALQVAHLTAAQYQLLCDVREFDLRQGWT